MLQRFGVIAESLPSGQQAVQRLLSQHDYDCVLMDVRVSTVCLSPLPQWLAPYVLTFLRADPLMANRKGRSPDKVSPAQADVRQQGEDFPVVTKSWSLHIPESR